MSQSSLLTRAMLEPVLKTARRNLERDGCLAPFLFVQMSVAGLRLVPLGLPQTSEQKRRYLAHLGSSFCQHRQTISAAVMLTESWFVNVRANPVGPMAQPSKHPMREEAIIMVGRDANNARTTQVIQPFDRDAQNRPVWSKSLIAVYDEPVQTAGKSRNLLDYLFLANQGVN